LDFGPAGGKKQKQGENNQMKLATKILAVLGVAAVVASNPLLAGDGKTFKDKVIVEETSKWWGASLSTGWDSLYMFRGVNVLRNDMSYGSGIYWTNLDFTWNITENDFLTVGTWVAFGTQKTDYKELDVFTSYTHTFGDFSLSLGYIFYYVWSSPLYSHELNVSGAYEFDLGFMTITPSLTYFFNVGPSTAEQGIAPEASSYLLARIDASIGVYKDVISIDPWVSFGTNFRYNAKEDGSFFNGANDLQVGIGIPIKINDVISLYGYGAYSYQWYDLVGTRPSTFWGGASVIFSF
jgi:hypothetical protein